MPPSTTKGTVITSIAKIESAVTTAVPGGKKRKRATRMPTVPTATAYIPATLLYSSSSYTMYSSEKSRASKSANGAIVSTADTYTDERVAPPRGALREVDARGDDAFRRARSSSLSATSLAKRRPDGDASQLRSDG